MLHAYQIYEVGYDGFIVLSYAGHDLYPSPF